MGSCFSQEVCLFCDCGSAKTALESNTPATTRHSAESLNCSRSKGAESEKSGG